MRRRSRHVLVVLIALLAVPLAACGGDDAAGGGDDAGGSGAVDGREIYDSTCAGCHGPDGEGGQGMPLGDGAVEESLTLDEQIDVITNGRNTMPAWGGELTDEEIEAVAVYEREELGR